MRQPIRLSERRKAFYMLQRQRNRHNRIARRLRETNFFLRVKVINLQSAIRWIGDSAKHVNKAIHDARDLLQ